LPPQAARDGKFTGKDTKAAAVAEPLKKAAVRRTETSAAESCGVWTDRSRWRRLLKIEISAMPEMRYIF